MEIFKKSTAMPVNARKLWDWHMRPGAFERLTPPWEGVEVEEGACVEAGARARFRIGAGPLRLRWEAEIDDVIPGSQFRDRQVRGPFAEWEHTHRFLDEAEGRALLEDEVHYRLPMGAVGALAGGALTRRKLRRMFGYRHEVTRRDLERWFGGDLLEAKVVLVTGAGGLIGRSLVPLLRMLGHTVRTLSRRPVGAGAFGWDPSAGRIDDRALEGVQAVIHLAGENIAGGLWTQARRERILRSRVDGTRLLAEAAAALPVQPEVFVCASGVNIYAADGRPHDETGRGGDGFLAEVCRKWEGSAQAAETAGVRTVFVRTGVVLSPGGGALGKMLPAFRLGLGGPVGGGAQHMSWIAMDDLVDVYAAAMTDVTLRGPVNAVAPEAVPQREFARVLGRVLRRPAVAPLPGFVVKGALGQLGRETLLADLNVVPGVLRSRGHSFRYPRLEGALRHLLGKSA
ncbi:MAG: TIGR01777 family oxidoreductase [Opitutales bacterium]|nr:TIGR01777 family oxidoreductase [Opitutales bacterium]